MDVWQPDCHRDRLDEFVFVDISMRPPRGPSAPARRVPADCLSPARPSPLACLCQYLEVPGEIPFNANLCEPSRLSFIFPSLFIFSRPSSSLLPQLREEVIRTAEEAGTR